MKPINKNISFLQYSQIIFLGVLLILAPCSVRNYIEHSYGLEKTEVTNKSKAAINEDSIVENCIADDYLHVDTNQKSKKAVSTVYNLNAVKPENQNFFNPPVYFGLNQFFQNQSLNKVAEPLYLLYQNLKLGKLQVF